MEKLINEFESISEKFKDPNEEIYEILIMNGFERKNPIDFVYVSGTLSNVRGIIKVTVTAYKIFVTVAVKDKIVAIPPKNISINNLISAIKEGIEKLKEIQ